MNMSQMNHNPDEEQDIDDDGETGMSMDFLDMPDADVMGMSASPAPKAPAAAPAKAEGEGEDAGAKDDDAAGSDATAGDGTGAAGDGKPEGEVDAGKKEDDKPAVDAALNAADDQIPDPKAAKPAAKEADKVEPAKDEKTDADKDKVAPPVVGLTIEQKAAAYDEVLAPFKANNKEFKPQSIEELRQLAQMGCNYTKKMQELQPVKRIITMLSNNQLLDEGKLNFLIDLDKGNPEAIQKLLADRQFDPMTADKDKAASYKPGNHQVSDEEVTLQTAMEEVIATPTGPGLIASIKNTWDERSKQALFQDPATLRAINDHKASGLYDQITAEMERLTTLGRIPVDTPFLQAYKACGDMLHDRWKAEAEALEAAKQKETPAATPPAAVTPAPETRVVAPPSQVANNDKAKAAAPTKSGAPVQKAEVNYLDIPDDEFLKRTGHRL